MSGTNAGYAASRRAEAGCRKAVPRICGPEAGRVGLGAPRQASDDLADVGSKGARQPAGGKVRTPPRSPLRNQTRETALLGVGAFVVISGTDTSGARAHLMYGPTHLLCDVQYCDYVAYAFAMRCP
eukprot:1429348-Rhodomonas_salina.2